MPAGFAARWSPLGPIVLALSAALLVSACASYGGKSLIPGTATESDVVRALGTPSQILERPDGGKTLYFSQSLLGRQTWAATMRGDGPLAAIEQVLDYEHMKRIRVGVDSAAQVREILGPPYKIARYAFKPLDVWEYPWNDAAGQKRILSISLSDDGVVRQIADARDRDADGGPKY